MSDKIETSDMPAAAPTEISPRHKELLDRLLDRHPLHPRGAPERLRLTDLPASDLAWLLTVDSTSDRHPIIPLLAQELLRRRADIRQAFPDPLGSSRLAFAYWFSTWGRAEYGLERTLVRQVVRTLPFKLRVRCRMWWLRYSVRKIADRWVGAIRSERTISDPPGDVNLVGWVESPTGVAQACRGSIEAMEAAQLRFQTTPLDLLPDLPSYRWAASQIERCRLPIQLLHVNADMMDFVYRRLPAVDRDRTLRIGYWFWELSQFPAELHWTYGFVDQVWTPSRFCFDALSEFAPVEIRWVPPCVPAPVPQPGARSRLEIPLDRFLFFSSFDARSVVERKNPIGLVDAFAQVASLASKKVHLLFNVVHPEAAPDLVNLLQEQTDQLPITILAGGVSRIEYSAMLTACDALVSLHRSEGLGLPMIEAMYLGKPVIGTEYGGCLDYLDESTGWPVDYRIVRIDKSTGPYPAGFKWAEPDIQDAVRKMLFVVDHPDWIQERCQAAKTRVSEIYSPGLAGERFRREIERAKSQQTPQSENVSS